MKKLFWALIFISTILSACKDQPNSKVWTKDYEQGLYNYLDSTTKPLMPDEKKRVKYIEYFISRVKEKVPNGLNSVSKDSLQSLNIIIGREYVLRNGTGIAGQVSYKAVWTPFVEKAFRDNYNALFSEKYPKTTGKFCDCIIKELKLVYPDSLICPCQKMLI
jgi:hypothetical protein